MKLIVCKKENCKGIYAELVGDKLLKIEKRKTDRHPLLLKITGNSFDVISACTLCGDEEFIEVQDGKINTDDLKVVETKGANDGEELKEEDIKQDDGEKDGDKDSKGTGDGTGDDDKSGAGDDGKPGTGDNDES